MNAASFADGLVLIESDGTVKVAKFQSNPDGSLKLGEAMTVDQNGVVTINGAELRILNGYNINSSGNIVLTGEDKQQIQGDGGNAIILNFSNGRLIANIAGGKVADFVELVLTDGSQPSILFGARSLNDSQGAPVLSWDGDVQLAPGKAIRIPASNGTIYRVSVDNDGNLISVAM